MYDLGGKKGRCKDCDTGRLCKIHSIKWQGEKKTKEGIDKRMSENDFEVIQDYHSYDDETWKLANCWKVKVVYFRIKIK